VNTEHCKTELQVQKEMGKKRFLTSAPHGRGVTPYTETVEYQDMIHWEIESLKVTQKLTLTLTLKVTKMYAVQNYTGINFNIVLY